MISFAEKLSVRRKRDPTVMIRCCTILIFNVKILREIECLYFF
jgi:hypothetical protein